MVTHVGTAYKTASPRYYLDALDGMPEEIRSRIETRFVGRIAETERPVFESRQSLVRMLGFKPQAEALREMEETDYLLLTMTERHQPSGQVVRVYGHRKTDTGFISTRRGGGPDPERDKGGLVRAARRSQRHPRHDLRSLSSWPQPGSARRRRIGKRFAGTSGPNWRQPTAGRSVGCWTPRARQFPNEARWLQFGIFRPVEVVLQNGNAALGGMAVPIPGDPAALGGMLHLFPRGQDRALAGSGHNVGPFFHGYRPLGVVAAQREDKGSPAPWFPPGSHRNPSARRTVGHGEKGNPGNPGGRSVV